MIDEIGMMWSVSSKQFYDDVIVGLNHYEKHYLATPTWVHVHSLENAKELDSLKEDGIVVTVDSYIIKNNVWIGHCDKETNEIRREDS